MPLPEVALSGGSLADSSADTLALGLRQVDGKPVAGAGAVELVRRLDIDLELAVRRASVSGNAAEVVDLTVARSDRPVERVLLVGLGDGSPLALRRAGAAIARRAAKGRHIAADTGAGLDAPTLQAHVEGLLLASYRFSPASRPQRPTLRQVDLHLRPRAGLHRAVGRARTTAQAAHLARDLANTPSNVKNPAWLARQAVTLARRTGLEVSVRDEKALRADGFGGLVAVGTGSSSPPRLIQLAYRPATPARRSPHVVLVGKGITFDSGGLSLKGREAMAAMKTDMAAGGAVIAVMGALKDLGVRARVTGVVAAAENLPGASAYRPGDVVRHFGGRTVEVFNTDAEGRLVLADALAYADAELEPDVLIDLATLTGAASLGLGRRHAALYTADDPLAAALATAGEDSGERVWRMPLVEDYRPYLDSGVADLSHVSRDKRISGGSITAALFLREFVGARRWVHLDIAGPARAERDEHEITKGATGFGVRLLLRWLTTL